MATLEAMAYAGQAILRRSKWRNFMVTREQALRASGWRLHSAISRRSKIYHERADNIGREIEESKEQ
eukprot:scaffold3516_cov105-Skeletonema_marinoi.AAC.6